MLVTFSCAVMNLIFNPKEVKKKKIQVQSCEAEHNINLKVILFHSTCKSLININKLKSVLTLIIFLILTFCPLCNFLNYVFLSYNKIKHGKHAKSTIKGN